MTYRFPAALAALLTLAACAPEGPPLGPTAADLNPGESAGLETVAPGAEGLYEGDPLAGANLDGSDDGMGL